MDKYNCPCGDILEHGSVFAHKKSKTHLKSMELKTEINKLLLIISVLKKDKLIVETELSKRIHINFE